MDISEHPHFALLQSESYVSPTERAWEQWVKRVEDILGHSLDGNQELEGYSLDFAHDAFADGLSATEYAAEVKHAKAVLAIDLESQTRAYTSADGKHQIEICPNHSGLLFWRARTVGPFETSNRDFGDWSQWMPVAEARNYDHAFKVVTFKMARGS